MDRLKKGKITGWLAGFLSLDYCPNAFRKSLPSHPSSKRIKGLFAMTNYCVVKLHNFSRSYSYFDSVLCKKQFRTQKQNLSKNNRALGNFCDCHQSLVLTSLNRKQFRSSFSPTSKRSSSAELEFHSQCAQVALSAGTI